MQLIRLGILIFFNILIDCLCNSVVFGTLFVYLWVVLFCILLIIGGIFGIKKIVYLVVTRFKHRHCKNIKIVKIEK